MAGFYAALIDPPPTIHWPVLSPPCTGEFGLAGRSAVESAILDDLHSACGFEPKRPRDGSASAFGELDVFGLTRSYHMKPDEMTRDRLVVIAARERPCGWLEQRRETAITPIVEFRLWIGVEGGTHPDHT